MLPLSATVCQNEAMFLIFQKSGILHKRHLHCGISLVNMRNFSAEIYPCVVPFLNNKMKSLPSSQTLISGPHNSLFTLKILRQNCKKLLRITHQNFWSGSFIALADLSSFTRYYQICLHRNIILWYTKQIFFNHRVFKRLFFLYLQS